MSIVLGVDVCKNERLWLPQLCGSRGPLRMTHPENNGLVGVSEVGQVLPGPLI